MKPQRKEAMEMKRNGRLYMCEKETKHGRVRVDEGGYVFGDGV